MHVSDVREFSLIGRPNASRHRILLDSKYCVLTPGPRLRGAPAILGRLNRHWARRASCLPHYSCHGECSPWRRLEKKLEQEMLSSSRGCFQAAGDAFKQQEMLRSQNVAPKRKVSKPAQYCPRISNHEDTLDARLACPRTTERLENGEHGGDEITNSIPTFHGPLATQRIACNEGLELSADPYRYPRPVFRPRASASLLHPAELLARPYSSVTRQTAAAFEGVCRARRRYLPRSVHE